MRFENGEIRLEKVTEDHVPFICRINLDVMPRKRSEGFFETFYQLPVAEDYCLAAVHYEDDDSQYGFLFHEPKRRVAGFIYAAKRLSLSIQSIAVAKRFQRHGVGSMLLNAVVAKAGESEIHTAPIPEGDGFAEAGLFFRLNGFRLDRLERVRTYPGSPKIKYQGYIYKHLKEKP